MGYYKWDMKHPEGFYQVPRPKSFFVYPESFRLEIKDDKENIDLDQCIRNKIIALEDIINWRDEFGAKTKCSEFIIFIPGTDSENVKIENQDNQIIVKILKKSIILLYKPGRSIKGR